VRTLLASPRRRRRFAFSAGTLVVAAPLIFLAFHFSSSGSAGNANGPSVDESSFYRHPRHVRFTAPERAAVHRLLRRFVTTAVARRHVAASWPLAGPSLRKGITAKQWASGDIPVVPYPVSPHGQGAWSAVQYSYRDEVGLEVLLFPRRCSGWSIATVDATVVRGRDRRWRVNYWMITKFHGPGTTAPADSPSALGEGPGNVHRLPGKKSC